MYLRSTGGKLFGRPATGIDSKYLLTGMLTCGVCDSAMTIRSRQSGRRRVFAYMCRSNISERLHQRGRSQYTNNQPLRLPAIDQAILGHLESTVLNP